MLWCNYHKLHVIVTMFMDVNGSIVLLPSNPSYVLVGGFNHLEKYEFVNGKDDIPYNYYGKLKKCLKPPTSVCWCTIWLFNIAMENHL